MTADLETAPGHHLTRRGFLVLSVATGIVALIGTQLTQCRRENSDSLAPPAVVPRTDWGAVEPNLDSPEGLYDPIANPGGWLVYTDSLPEVLNTIVVHHSALPLSDGPLEIQQKHMKLKGFADIGYHFLIDAQGQLYEGRSLAVRGAHTGGHNTGTIGVVLLGNFQVSEPTAAQLATLRVLSAHLVDEYTITHMAGHRDFQPGVTDCPGDSLEALLPDLAAELGIEFGVEGYVGP